MITWNMEVRVHENGSLADSESRSAKNRSLDLGDTLDF